MCGIPKKLKHRGGLIEYKNIYGRHVIQARGERSPKTTDTCEMASMLNVLNRVLWTL